MAQKLLKHELVERLLQLKEKQDLLTVQMQLLMQEISELAAPFMPKAPKSQSVITTRLIAQVLRENQGDMVDVRRYRRTGITVSGATTIC